MNFANEIATAIDTFKKTAKPFIENKSKSDSPVTIVLNDGKIPDVILIQQYGSLPDFMFILDIKNNIMAIKISKIEGIYTDEFVTKTKGEKDGSKILEALNSIPEPLSSILKGVAVKVMKEMMSNMQNNKEQPHPKEEDITDDIINKYFRS